MKTLWKVCGKRKCAAGSEFTGWCLEVPQMGTAGEDVHVKMKPKTCPMFLTLPVYSFYLNIDI